MSAFGRSPYPPWHGLTVASGDDRVKYALTHPDLCPEPKGLDDFGNLRCLTEQVFLDTFDRDLPTVPGLYRVRARTQEYHSVEGHEFDRWLQCEGPIDQSSAPALKGAFPWGAEEVAELRRLAAAALAETELPGQFFGQGGPSVWSACVDAGLGGITGQYCAAVHPERLLALLDALEQATSLTHDEQTGS